MKIVKVESSQGCMDMNLGCEKAPDAILETLSFDGEIDGVNVVENSLDETEENIYKKAKETFSENKNEFIVFLGGDHSITYGTFKAFSEQAKKPALLIFDAHPDCVADFSPISHEDLVRAAVNEGMVDVERLLLAGIRKVDAIEEKFIREKKLNVVYEKEIKSDFEKAKKKISGFIADNKEIYLSIDIDVLSPEEAPGTGYLEKGGLTKKELSDLLDIVKQSGNVKAMDLVEVNPSKDRGGRTAGAAAGMLQKFIFPGKS